MYPMPQCCTGEDCLRRTGWTVPHAIVTILRTDNYFHMFEVCTPAVSVSVAQAPQDSCKV